jgi:hypothetical protein
VKNQKEDVFEILADTKPYYLSSTSRPPAPRTFLAYCRGYALCEINSSGKEFTQTQRIDDHITFVFSEVPDRNT